MDTTIPGAKFLCSTDSLVGEFQWILVYLGLLKWRGNYKRAEDSDPSDYMLSIVICDIDSFIGKVYLLD